MFEDLLLSHFAFISTGDLTLQWYFSHLNTGPLIQAWQQGEPFSQNDWLTFMVFNINVLILFALLRLFLTMHEKSVFHTWIQNKRSQLTQRTPKDDHAEIKAKTTSSSFLNQAYNLHRFAMYDSALSKYEKAFQSAPHELNTYLVGIKIISEMESPNKKFIQFFKRTMATLHKEQPAIWLEVAKYGKAKLPHLNKQQAV